MFAWDPAAPKWEVLVHFSRRQVGIPLCEHHRGRVTSYSALIVDIEIFACAVQR